ncbi:Crp/Fnr family transcriptional regulator [Bosea sp. CS1GBMeth4]|uniref:Crp/Fnr family transcriptional regulator n=1 Tax=Bosea sp. CS1GBMeth4 TaxID=1892849 RepID=UPI0016491AB5|nr:Crp/Fnr family transcriptional regulator [Bosea sp. CS1GBMeth4]
MSIVARHDLHFLVHRLSRGFPLSDMEASAISHLPIMLKHVEAGADILREGDPASEACIVLEGLVCRYEIVAEGGRQIQAYHIPGDIPDLAGLHLQTLEHNICALRPSIVAMVSHRALHILIAEHPQIGARLWRETAIDAAVAHAWVSNIGRRTARARMAHFLCEMLARYQALDLASDTIPCIITQLELGDSQGMSVVHVNRVLKSLKRAGLIEMRGKNIRIRDQVALQFAGDFDPSYLHLSEAVH